MKKIVTLGVLSLGVLFLSGCGQQQTNQTQPTAPKTTTQQPSQIVENQQDCGSKRKQCHDGSYVNDTGPNCSFQDCERHDLSNLNPESWTKYTNNRLGFSLMIPKSNLPNGKDGKKYPVQVVENGDDVRIYSTDMKENDGTWTIKIRKIKDELDINSFMNTVSREGCKVYRKDPSLQAGAYDITVAPDSADTENLCGGMSAYVLKYFPEKNIIAYWDMGQDNRFLIPLTNPIVNDGITQDMQGADQIMATSFEFTK